MRILICILCISYMVQAQIVQKFDNPLDNFSLFTASDSSEDNDALHQQNCNTKGNVVIEQGALTLQTTYNDDDMMKACKNGKFMSGLIESAGFYKFSKVEIRAALPKGKLLRPTIVLKTRGIYGIDPRYGQIDLVVYNQDKLTHAVHANINGEMKYRGNDTHPDTDLSQFNVYSVERTNTSLIFKLNHKQNHIYSFENNYSNGFNSFNMSDGFKLVINVGVGGHPDHQDYFFSGDQDISLKDVHDWPCSVLIIDYIKIVEWGYHGDISVYSTNSSSKQICDNIMNGIRPDISRFDWLLAIIITTMNMVTFIVIMVLVKCAKKKLKEYKNQKEVVIGRRKFIRKELIDQKNVDTMELIGQGNFGIVYNAIYRITDKYGQIHPLTIVLKMPKAINDPDAVNTFIQEAYKMKNFKHENVINTLGLIMDGDTPKIMMRHMLHGDLKTFLTKNPDTDTERLIDFSLQIAKGMKYLSSKNYIHQDLAARNCMIGVGFVVKVCDFGLTKHLYEQKFYKTPSDHTMPVRWVAVEYFLDGLISCKADVWSYGVVLWEIFNKADKPYSHIDDEKKVKEYVLECGRLTQTATFPDCMFRLADSCWRTDPNQRPSFTEIVGEISKIKSIYCSDSMECDEDGYLAKSKQFKLKNQVQNNGYLSQDLF